jgi:chemotaxis protein histidine kinase CheA
MAKSSQMTIKHEDLFLVEMSTRLNILQHELVPLTLHNFKTVFRHLHSMKGDAASARFYTLAEFIHELESFLCQIKEQNLFSQMDVQVLFQKSLESMGLILADVKNRQELKIKTISIEQLKTFCEQSLPSGFELHFKGEVNFVLDYFKYRLLEECVGHLVRNSVDHGQGSQITLEVSTFQGQHLHLLFKDNGQGLDEKKIKEKVLDLNLLTQHELDEMTKKEIFELIFIPGLSTKTQLTLDENGGKISVESKNDGVVFKIYFPI